MSLSSALDQLANYRAHNTRASQDILEKGIHVVNSNGLRKLGDDAWAFREQLALAAIDVGRFDVADDCLEALSKQFPGSPRVDVLTGIRMEATQQYETVLQFYDQLLEEDSANGAIWKRRISLLRRMGRIEAATEKLSSYLDTFYSDVEGWLELADIYSSCNQYGNALRALSHAMILSPQNAYYVLQFAETAYTANDVPLAVKMFLLVIDMSSQDADFEEEDKKGGIVGRTWWGINLCCYRFLRSPSCPSASGTSPPKNVEKLHELAVEQVLKIYAAGEKTPGKQIVSAWVEKKLQS